MIEFSIPDFWEHYNLNLYLLELMSSDKDKFNPDVKVTSVYGSFPCVWNGGRLIQGSTNVYNIRNTIKPFNDQNISIRYTFTNFFIDETMTKDILGNTILCLSKTNNKLNGVNVGNDVMFQYVKDNYPEFYILHSTTLGITEPDSINKLSEQDIVIPDYRLNNKFDIISKFKNKQNIEFLVGEACIDNCPNRKLHHENCSRALAYIANASFSCLHLCEDLYSFYETIPLRKHYISYEDIVNKYVPLGFNKFKISGRNDLPIHIIERYVHWLVKPEYQNLIRNKLLLSLFKQY